MPLVPTAAVKLEVLIIVFLVGILVFLYAFKASHVQFSKKRDCEPVPEKFWSPWGACTRDCQGGLQYRTRSVAVTPLNGGANCTEDQLLQSRSCNATVECGQNCRPGNPADYEWFPCPPCKDSDVQPVQWKIIPPVRTATFGGQDCNIDQVLQLRECENYIPPCPPNVNCALSPYYITPCSVPCGSGTQYIFSSVSQFPSGNGKSCDYSLLVTQQTCFLGACNCDSLSWTNTFSECNAACGPGVQVMFREPQPNNPADGLCPYLSVTACTLTDCPNSTCVAPSVDFVQALCYLVCAGFSVDDIDIDSSICISDDILNAVCGFNNLASFQALLQSSVTGYDLMDVDAKAALVSTWFGFQNCAAPKDCSLSSFSDFGNCSLHTCLRELPYGGTRTRVRTIIDPGNSGGLPCTDQIFIDYEPCNHSAIVSYTAWDETIGNFIQSVSSPQCSFSDCTLSSWYSVSSFMGGCGSTCSQTWNRSISNAGTNPGTCPTQSNAYVSTTECCGVDPDAVQTNCGTLPTCEQCKWLTWTSLSLRCNYDIYDRRTVTIDAPLIQETNIPGPSCFQLASQCSWDYIVANNPTWSQFSCSRYFKVCNSPNICPIGCDNLVCSGHGITSITSYSAAIESCTCICDYGFSGTACETVLDQCPIASYTGLECNGQGNCSGSPNYTCTCDNPNDLSVDCTGSSTSWCWVYGVVDGNLQGTTNTNIFSTVRKLLGAIPIASTSNYVFTEKSCQSISGFGSTTLASITLVQPQPVLFGMNFAGNLNNVSPAQVSRIQMYGMVNSEPPTTLITELGSVDLCRDYGFPNNRSTKQLLSQTFGTTFASQFIPRYMPSSSPIQCENIYTFSTFVGANQTTSVLSLSNVTATGPLPAPYAATGTLTCASNVGTFRYRNPFGTLQSLAPSIGLPIPSNGELITFSNISETLYFTATSSIGVTDTVYTGSGGWFSPSNNLILFTFSSADSCSTFASNTSVIPGIMTYDGPTL